jgi:hypothetical protein
MRAQALGGTALVVLLAAAVIGGSNGYALGQHDIELDALAVPMTIEQRIDHLPASVEFPRQEMRVWFYNPVKVGDRILMGQYVIEHDNERMARGHPCTHIYAATDHRLPVVAFSCRHLTRTMVDQPTVIVRSLGEANGMTALVAFQFAGEAEAHGVPTTR